MFPLCVTIALMVAFSAGRAAGQPAAKAPREVRLAPAEEARFTEGVEALKANHLDVAEAAFKDVLRTQRDVAFVHHNLGVVLHRRQRHADALTELRAAIRLDPAYGPSHLLAGTSLLALRRPREALGHLRTAERLMPSDVLVPARQAEAYEQITDLPRVVDALRRCRTLAPEDPEHAYRLGRAYLALAEWSIDRLQRVNARSPRLLQLQAHTYLEQGQTALAIRALQTAAAADGRLPEVHLALAALYFRENQLDAAATAVARELAVVPDSRAALALQAEIERARTRSR